MGDMTQVSETSDKVTESYKNSKFSFEEKPYDKKIVLQIAGKSIKVVKKMIDIIQSIYLMLPTHLCPSWPRRS